MITLSPQQLNVLDSQVKEAFATKLTHTLIASYPQLFTPLPFELAQRLVAAKISYAETRYQLRFQSALSTYLHYCCAIGAKFDQQAEIQGLLDGADYRDTMPQKLAQQASEDAWQSAQRSATLYDWLDERLDLVDRVAARYCWSLAHDKTIDRSDVAIKQHIRQAIATAKPLSIETDLGIAAFAICQTKLGHDFYQRHATTWTHTIFNDPEIPPACRGPALAGCVLLEWT